MEAGSRQDKRGEENQIETFTSFKAAPSSGTQSGGKFRRCRANAAIFVKSCQVLKANAPCQHKVYFSTSSVR